MPSSRRNTLSSDSRLMSVGRTAVLAALLTLGAFVTLAGQDGEIRIRATRRDTIRAGATVTAAFSVANAAPDTANLSARVDVPRDWSLLMAPQTLTVPGRSSELAMIALAVPSRAAAGVYVIRVALVDIAERAVSSDSVLVVVPARRSLFLAPLSRPGFVVSG